MPKDECYYTTVLEQYMKNRNSVSHDDVREAVIYFRNKKRPEFIPENVWKKMLSWG